MLLTLYLKRIKTSLEKKLKIWANLLIIILIEIRILLISIINLASYKINSSYKSNKVAY